MATLRDFDFRVPAVDSAAGTSAFDGPVLLHYRQHIVLDNGQVYRQDRGWFDPDHRFQEGPEAVSPLWTPAEGPDALAVAVAGLGLGTTPTWKPMEDQPEVWVARRWWEDGAKMFNILDVGLVPAGEWPPPDLDTIRRLLM